MLSPLALIHPLGYVRHGVALGSAVPDSLMPQACSQPGEKSDLVVISPGSNERKRPGWWEEALETADRQLARDGLLYVIAPPWPRELIFRELRGRGFNVGPPTLHLPHLKTSRYLVPFTPAAIRSAASLARARRWRAAAAESLALLSHCPGLAKAAPCIGFAATRDGRPHPFHWLTRWESGNSEALAIVRTSWRASGPSTVHTLTDHASDAHHTWLFAKVWPAGSTPQYAACEAHALQQLGPCARVPDVDVPAILSAHPIGPHPALIRTALPGTPAASILSAHPHRLPELLGRLSAWLREWNGRTAGESIAGAGRLERDVLSLLDRLAHHLRDGRDYRAWLISACERAAEKPIVRVHSHNDLTAWNVLVADHVPLGIIDWEVARFDGYRYTDFAYAAVDFVAATGNYRDRLRAFQDCFCPGGRHRPMIAAELAKFHQALGTPSAADEVCFHACWLRHAANEAAETSGGPFLRIARWMAANRTLLRGALDPTC